MKFLIDTHTHTIASGHAYSTIDEMTQEASRMGVTHLAFTEHAPNMPGSCGELYFHNLKVNRREKYGVTRLFGCEVNIMDLNGSLDMPNYILEQLDIAIASLHTPCVCSGSINENTRALVKAIMNPYINIIGHPDDSRYPLDYEQIVMAAKEYHTLLELNNSSLKPSGPRVKARNNDLRMLELCKKNNVCISLGSDAHVAEDICNFELAYQLLEEVDFPERMIANSDIDLLNSYLKADEKLFDRQ